MADTNLRDGSGNPITSTGNALDVNIKTGGGTGGGGSNGAASATGAAVPVDAGYTGFNSGGNLVGVSSAAPLPVTLGGTQAVSLSTLPVAPANTGIDIGNVGIKAGSAVIGHVIVDSGAIAATLAAETTKIIGTVNVASGQTVGLVASTAVIGHVINDASTAVIGHVIVDSGAVNATLGAETTKVIGTVNVAASQTIAVTNTGTFATQATLAAETTKVIGTVNVASGQTVGLVAGSAVIGHVIVDTAPSTAVTNAGTFATQSTLAAETTKVIGTARIIGNTGAVVDAAVGTLPTNNLAHIAVPTAGAGGALSCVVKSAQATAVNIKATAGNLYGFAIVSATATAGFVEFFNTATTATSGAVLAVPIAASGTLILTPSQIALLNFSTGIAINVATPLNGTTTQITWTGSIWFL